VAAASAAGLPPFVLSGSGFRGRSSSPAIIASATSPRLRRRRYLEQVFVFVDLALAADICFGGCGFSILDSPRGTFPDKTINFIFDLYLYFFECLSIFISSSFVI
jgi:hypothetical protein